MFASTHNEFGESESGSASDEETSIGRPRGKSYEEVWQRQKLEGHPLLPSDGLSRKRFDWLTREAPFCCRGPLGCESGPHLRPNALGKSNSEKRIPTSTDEFEALGASCRAAGESDMQRSTARYLEVCNSYGIKPNGGALLGFSLGLDVMELDEKVTNLDLVPLCAGLLEASFTSVIKLVHQPLMDTGAAVLALALPACKNIHTLELIKCQITGRGAKALADAIMHTGVEVLVLRQNILRHHASQGNAALAHLVATVPTLRHLDLQSSSLTSSGMRMIKKAMADRHATGLPPCQVNFEGNFVIVEVMNAITHGICAVISIEGWRMLNVLILQLCHFQSKLSLTVYIASMLAMFSGSTLYHSTFVLTELAWFFVVLDHCAIYFLIAGTYTPVLVMGCRDPSTLQMYGGVPAVCMAYWTLVLLGVTMEVLAGVHKPTWYPKFILFMYVLMGFGGIPYISSCPIVEKGDVMPWIEAGGAMYMFGVIFFLLDKRYPAMHIVWHVFVGVAAALHFIGVWNITTEVIDGRHAACFRNASLLIE